MPNKRYTTTELQTLMRYCIKRRRLANRAMYYEVAKQWDIMFWVFSKLERKLCP